MNSKTIQTPYNQTIILGTRWGHMMGLMCDPFQTASLGLYGEWARGESDAICSFLKPGDVAIDVGANIGTMTIPMAKKVGGSGLVISFEPQRAPFMCLCGNVALTHCLQQVRCLNAAAGDRDDMIDVPVVDINKPFNVGGVRLQDTNYDAAVKLRKEAVPVMTIDGLALNRVNLIKIDVETMESKVLAGAIETVLRCRPVIFAEALYDDSLCEGSSIERTNLEAMKVFFAGVNYDPRFLITTLYDEWNNRYCPDNIFPGGDRNIVALPAEMPDKPEWFTKLSRIDQ